MAVNQQRGSIGPGIPPLAKHYWMSGSGNDLGLHTSAGERIANELRCLDAVGHMFRFCAHTRNSQEGEELVESTGVMRLEKRVEITRACVPVAGGGFCVWVHFVF